MKVDTYRRATGETMVEIQMWDGNARSSLTISEVRQLYTLLTPILEAEHNAEQLAACREMCRVWEREAGVE